MVSKRASSLWIGPHISIVDSIQLYVDDADEQVYYRERSKKNK